MSRPARPSPTWTRNIRGFGATLVSKAVLKGHYAMSRAPRALLAALTLLALQPLVGCSSPSTMTEQQREGVELRRYCERTNDVNKCHGFMGFL
jgi:hypothetical protein